ncbi:hypothetical protein OSL26_22160, partial [Escherichia coli]|nr:hypothetical protein [Escherichia coli]
MLKTRLITDYINSLIGQEFVQGENDCNLIACKIIDILAGTDLYNSLYKKYSTKEEGGNDSNLLIVFYVQIMPDDFVMQLHR